MQDLVARDNSALFSIHQLMAVFGDQDRERVRALVDDQLTDQIDYRLVDYHRAAGSNQRLVDAVYALDPDGPQQKSVYKELVALCINMTADRAQIEAATGQAPSPIEWTGLLLLLLLLLPLVALIAVLPGTLVTFMVLLRKLDRLRWHEVVTIREPTTRLFRKMGYDPSVPRDVIVSGRNRPAGARGLWSIPTPTRCALRRLSRSKSSTGRWACRRHRREQCSADSQFILVGALLLRTK